MIEYTGQIISYVENANENVAAVGEKVVRLVLILNSISVFYMHVSCNLARRRILELHP